MFFMDDKDERGFGPEAEYERLVQRGVHPERAERKYWSKAVSGLVRTRIVRRYRRNEDPQDPCPRWLRCPCSEHGGAIQMKWGHQPGCDACGAML